MAMSTLREIQSAHEKTGGFWFAPATLEWWRTKFSERVMSAPHGAYFLTRETNPSGVRMWSVRYASDEGEISTVGEFFSYVSEGDAWRAAQAAKDAGATE